MGAWQVPQWVGLQYFEPWLAVGPNGVVYATTSTNGAVVSFDANGTAGATIGVGVLRQPFGVVVAPSGASLLVADGALQTVLTVPLTQQ